MPHYNHHIFVCQNQRQEDHPMGCCLSKGSGEMYNYLKARVKELGLSKIRVNKSGCLGQCKNGPAMVIYPEGVWYTLSTIKDIDRVIESHLIHNQKVDEFLIN